MKERRSQRIKGGIKIVLQDEGSSFPGTVIDISRFGLSVRTAHVFPTYKEIAFILKIGGQTLALRGSVRWVNDHPPQAPANTVEMGIAILAPLPEFQDLLERFSPSV